MGSMPQAVQKQIDEANEIQKNLSTESKTDDLKTVDTTDKDKVPAKTEPDKKQPGNESSKQTKSKLEKLNERFLAYKRLYDKEVTGSRVELQKKNDEITQLRVDIEKLQAGSDQQEQQQKKDADNKEVLESISEKFGPEFVDAVSNLSTAQLMLENAKLLSRLDNIEKKLETRLTEQLKANEAIDESKGDNSQSKFISMLTEAVPSWNSINDSPKFKSWLDGVDTDGERRQLNLSKAQESGNVMGVADYFYQFIDAQSSSRTVDGEYLPNGKSGGDAPADSNEIIYSDEIDEYYKNKAIGNYSPEESQSLQARIDNAAAKGNIRQR